MKTLFILGVGLIALVLLLVEGLQWLIIKTREPFQRIEERIDEYLRSLCDDPEGKTR